MPFYSNSRKENSMIKVMFICHGNMCRSYMIKKCTVYYNNGRVDIFPRTPTFKSRYRAMWSVWCVYKGNRGKTTCNIKFKGRLSLYALRSLRQKVILRRSNTRNIDACTDLANMPVLFVRELLNNKISLF